MVWCLDRDVFIGHLVYGVILYSFIVSAILQAIFNIFTAIKVLVILD